MKRVLRKNAPSVEIDLNQAVFTAEEAAAYLRISLKTLYKKADCGAIPGKKVGKDWRFYREELEKLLGR
jgi:excisionase family DNA binding protein